MCMVSEQCESPNETQKQSEKHAFGPWDDNEKGNVETKEGARSGSLAFLKEWHGKVASPTKDGRLSQGLAKPRGGHTYCKLEVGAVRRNMNGGMPEE